jgi:hypothetical protein
MFSRVRFFVSSVLGTRLYPEMRKVGDERAVDDGGSETGKKDVGEGDQRRRGKTPGGERG